MTDSHSVFELEETRVKLAGHDVPDVTVDGVTKGGLLMGKATVTEGFSRLTKTEIELYTLSGDVVAADMLGRPLNIQLLNEDGSVQRYFNGFCVAAEYLGKMQKYYKFKVVVRPWLWFLTRTSDCRVFQNITTTDLISQIFSEHGFSDFELQTTETYPEREYCIQYNETDYNFLCRLMDEVGLYFYFDDSTDNVNKLIITDYDGQFQVLSGEDGQFATLPYLPMLSEDKSSDPTVRNFSEAKRVTTGTETVQDFNFTTSTADLTGTTDQSIDQMPNGGMEVYSYPGRHPDADTGTTVSRIRAERQKSRHVMHFGVSNVMSMAPGKTFTLEDHDVSALNMAYLLCQTEHKISVLQGAQNAQQGGDEGDEAGATSVGGTRTEFHTCNFGAIPKDNALFYRPAKVTPWPRMPGLLTATVVGPDGDDDIHTDEYGRIKIQFHWDREGEDNETSSCFVRTMMPWTGKDWGQIWIPRVGTEVVIQFESGNPDRPMCVGMVYNDQFMPPYALDTNKTQSGVKTRSTPGGNENTFHELVFEDKFEEEFVRFQSERDYIQIIKNNADITIGMEHNDEGNLTQTIKNNKLETVKDGDHTLIVETGSQIIEIETDQTETIRGLSERTVTGDVTETVEEGKHETTVSSGDHILNVDSGSKTDTISTGDYDISVDAGTLTIEAGTKIELKVGANSIKIEQSGITISGAMVTVTGEATVEVGAPMIDVAADGILTLGGSLVQIN